MTSSGFPPPTSANRLGGGSSCVSAPASSDLLMKNLNDLVGIQAISHPTTTTTTTGYFDEDAQLGIVESSAASVERTATSAEVVHQAPPPPIFSSSSMLLSQGTTIGQRER